MHRERQASGGYRIMAATAFVLATACALVVFGLRSNDTQAAPAVASVSVSGTQLKIEGADRSEYFDIFVSGVDGTSTATLIGIYDWTEGVLNFQAPCKRANFPNVPTKVAGVVCPINVQSMHISTAGGNDTVKINQQPGLPATTSVYAGTGNDVVFGGLGVDTIYGDSTTEASSDGSDILFGGPNADTIYGGNNPTPVSSSADGDQVYGQDGDDALSGGGGHNDIVDGGKGMDGINCGSGDGDRTSYATRTTGVSVKIDTITNDGSIEDDWLYPGSGVRDRVDANCEVLWGTDANDNFYTTQPTKGIRGFKGDDMIVSGPGPQRIDGGDGFDKVTYADPWRGSTRNQPVNLTLDNAANDGTTNEQDNLFEVEHLVGGLGNDVIKGGNENGIFEGDAGDDTIDAGRGADVIAGNAGRDTADYLNRTPKLVVTLGQPAQGEQPSARGQGLADDGNEVQDRAAPGSGTLDNVTSTTENVLLGSNDDEASGNKLDNVLAGMVGSDRLEGNEGVDILLSAFIYDAGDTGKNELWGGPGTDVLLGANAIDVVHGGPDKDTLLGMSGPDWLLSDDDGTEPVQDATIDCAGPNPPNTQYDTGSAPTNEDWADIDVKDAQIATSCENIAEPAPDPGDFNLCDPAVPNSDACRNDI